MNTIASKIILPILFICGFSSCIFAQQKETRTISDFHTLKVSGLAVVHLSQGESKEVKIKVSGMPIEDLITKQEDGELTITTEGRHSGEWIKVELSANNLRKIEVSDAAQLYSTEALRGDKMSVYVHGAAEADLEVDVKLLAVKMEDAADLTLRGKTDQQYIVSAGSRGSLDNTKLSAGAASMENLNNSELDVKEEESSLTLKAIMYLFQ